MANESSNKTPNLNLYNKINGMKNKWSKFLAMVILFFLFLYIYFWMGASVLYFIRLVNTDVLYTDFEKYPYCLCTNETDIINKPLSNTNNPFYMFYKKGEDVNDPGKTGKTFVKYQAVNLSLDPELLPHQQLFFGTNLSNSIPFVDYLYELQYKNSEYDSAPKEAKEAKAAIADKINNNLEKYPVFKSIQFYYIQIFKGITCWNLWWVEVFFKLFNNFYKGVTSEKIIFMFSPLIFSLFVVCFLFVSLFGLFYTFIMNIGCPYYKKKFDADNGVYTNPQVDAQHLWYNAIFIYSFIILVGITLSFVFYVLNILYFFLLLFTLFFYTFKVKLLSNDDATLQNDDSKGKIANINGFKIVQEGMKHFRFTFSVIISIFTIICAFTKLSTPKDYSSGIITLIIICIIYISVFLFNGGIIKTLNDSGIALFSQATEDTSGLPPAKQLLPSMTSFIPKVNTSNIKNAISGINNFDNLSVFLPDNDEFAIDFRGNQREKIITSQNAENAWNNASTAANGAATNFSQIPEYMKTVFTSANKNGAAIHSTNPNNDLTQTESSAAAAAAATAATTTATTTAATNDNDNSLLAAAAALDSYEDPVKLSDINLTFPGGKSKGGSIKSKRKMITDDNLMKQLKAFYKKYGFE
jgi:hypothetical protein